MSGFFYFFSSGTFSLITLCSVDWDKIFYDCNNDVQLIYDAYLEIFHALIDLFIPKTAVHRKIKHSPELRSLAKKKAKLYKQCKFDHSLKSQYKLISKQYDNKVKEFYDKIENDVCNSRNKCAFYNYANKMLRVRRPIPSIKTDDGEILTDNFDKAEYFNRTFQSVFTEDDGISINVNAKTDVLMDDINVTDTQVLNALKQLEPKTSMSPDGIPAIVLKNTGHSIVNFLRKFFQLTLSTGNVPKQWKIASVIPVHKRGAKDKATNHRPVSLTSPTCRLLEYIIKEDILEHLFSHNLISSRQQGFLPKRGTSTQLLQTLNAWTRSFDEKEAVEIIYTDFSKAFDRVNHNKLVEVLRSFGIGGANLKWIESFLTGRNQFVTLDGVYSSTLAVTSGVPQGSVMGPLLFILYIEDIQGCCTENCKIGLYADDSKLWSSNSHSLQESLECFEKFVDKRQLRLATNKCRHLTIML